MEKYEIINFVQEIRAEMKDMLKEIVSGCWCKYGTWGSRKKADFIRKACEKMGLKGYEKEFSVLIGGSQINAYLVSKKKEHCYPQCMDYEGFLWACIMLKIVPDILARIREGGEGRGDSEIMLMAKEAWRIEEESDFSRHNIRELLKTINEFVYCV